MLYSILLISPPLCYCAILCSSLLYTALLYTAVLYLYSTSTLPLPCLYSTSTLPLLYFYSTSASTSTPGNSSLLYAALLYSSRLYPSILYSALLYLCLYLYSTWPLLYVYPTSSTQVPTGHNNLWASENVTWWFHRHMPTGHNDLWASENVTSWSRKAHANWTQWSLG